MKRILPYILSLLMISSAIAHIVAPEFYRPFIPTFVPEALANNLSVVLELVIGIGLLIPSKRKLAALAFSALMIAFLPIHVWDLLRENPAIGSFSAAVVRVIIQLVLIYGGWWLSKHSPSN